MIAIEKMYGICDGEDIIFENIGGDNWQAIIPADLNDGTYVVEIYAKAYTGEFIYYTAVLYMSDGRFVSLQPQKDEFYAVIVDNRTFARCLDNIIVKAKVSYEL